MPFGIIGRTGPGMRQVLAFRDQSTERGTFGDTFGARHCIQWGLYGVCDAASTVGAAVSGGACGGRRHCCIR